METAADPAQGAGGVVDLFWLPLGAGGSFVRLNGRLFEGLAARLQRRRRRDLYHSALAVELPGGSYVIEQAPALHSRRERPGVVATGPVGARWAGQLPLFRYEVRLWLGGRIPDAEAAVESPRRLSDELAAARHVVAAARLVPTPTWGRDELGAGEMWNSNSIIAWILTSGGIDAAAIEPPAGGRAPGWRAGITVAERRGGSPWRAGGPR